jgi:DNA end-binding protein Ku
MPPRSTWKGHLKLSLVSCPVRLYNAVSRTERVSFHLLQKDTHNRIQMKPHDPELGPVERSDLVKGYEYEKGRFVVLTKEDFTAAALEKTRRIDILDFVEASAIDDRFFDTPYYLTPGKGGDVAYGLLREAIRESGRIGISKFIMREVQHLAAVEVVDEALVLSTLRFADELVDASTLKLPKRVPVKKKELDMATSLVESLADEWKPEKYTDDYRDNLMKVIKAKMKGKQADLVMEEPPREAKVVDLMERLRQSLDKSSGRRGGGRRAVSSARSRTARGAARRSSRPARPRARAATRRSRA